LEGLLDLLEALGGRGDDADVALGAREAAGERTLSGLASRTNFGQEITEVKGLGGKNGLVGAEACDYGRLELAEAEQLGAALHNFGGMASVEVVLERFEGEVGDFSGVEQAD